MNTKPIPKSNNYKLYLTLLLTGFIPTIYTTVRVFYLGQLPSDYGFNIASQLAWVNLIYEIFDEALLLPLFFFVGQAIKSGQKEFSNFIKTGMIITFVVYLFLSVALMIFANPLTQIMAQDENVISETVYYIRLESIAKIFIALVRFITIVLITIGRYKGLIIILVVQTSLIILSDLFLVSSLDISLNLGVNGIAYTNIFVNLLIIIVMFITGYRQAAKLSQNEKLNFTWTQKLINIGSLSGIESFIRNIVFMIMVLRMVNEIGEQGTFWVANNFIWGWLLVPVLQLGEIVKKDFSTNDYNSIKPKLKNFFLVTTIIILLWLSTILWWDTFMIEILQISNANEVINIVLISLGFYIVFSYNNIIDSIFYALGRTDLMLIQSVCVNVIYYGVVFILYINGHFIPTLNNIAIMFGMGILIDSVITFIIFALYNKKASKILININNKN